MGVPPQPAIFFETPTPIKTDAPHGALPLQLKMKPPHLKNKPPPLKREAPFHEMIPGKSTIYNNLKSS